MYEVLEKFDEESIIGLCQFAGRAANFDEDYNDIAEGSEFVLWVESSEYYDAQAYRLKIIALKAGQQALEGADGSPANKMFQAEVLRTTVERDLSQVQAEDENDETTYPYGILFPNGFASIVDNAA